MNLLKQLEAEQMGALRGKKPLPEFRPGDTVKVNVKVVDATYDEKSKQMKTRERLQAFEGVCIARAGEGLNESFTVRKLSYGEGVERVFPVYSPLVDSVQVVRKGKVRWLGLSEAGPQSLARACKVHPIAALQTEYSLWARDVEDEILPACRRLGIGFVPYAPLGRGLLTGNVRSLEDIAPHDLRRRQPRFQPGNLERNLELLKPLDEIAAARGATKAQVALAWLLAQGEDIVPIPGTKQQKWLEQNIAALNINLDQTQLDVLADTFKPGARAGDRYTPGYFTTLGA